MKKLRTAATTFAVMALAAAPIGIASASNGPARQHGQAGQHGNHCGLGHQKHARGSNARHQRGLRIGQTCNKAHHGGGNHNNGEDDEGGEDSGE
jgi:hypothetical protein